MLTSLLVFVALTAPSPDYDVKIIRTPAAASVDVSQYACKVYAGRAMGSGANTAKGVVTCYHVIEGQSSIEVVCGDERAKATVVVVDRDYDLALLSVSWKQSHPIAELAAESPAKGAVLKSAGRCKDGTVTVEDHIVDSNDKKDIRFTNCSNSGRSGSGIFSSDGKLVGIVYGNSVDTEPYTGLARDVNHVVRLGSQYTPGKPVAAESPAKGTAPAGMQPGNCPGGFCPIQQAPQYQYRRRR